MKKLLLIVLLIAGCSNNNLPQSQNVSKEPHGVYKCDYDDGIPFDIIFFTDDIYFDLARERVNVDLTVDGDIYSFSPADFEGEPKVFRFDSINNKFIGLFDDLTESATECISNSK